MSEALEQKAFWVRDDQTAEWCLKKIAEAEEEKARWADFYKNQMEKVAQSCDETIETMKGFLREYFDKVPHKVTKTEENYRLPSGKLVLKRQAPTLERDDDALIEYLKENGSEKYIKVRESVDWAALKKSLKIIGETAVDEDGQVIPCIKVIENPDIFTIGK